MKRFLAGTCILAFALVASSAKAQTFQGIYVGGYGGGHQSDSDAHTFTVFSPTGYFATTSVPAIAGVGNQKISPSGGSGGGTFGFNLQHKSLVFGGETDFGMMKMNQSATGTATYPCCAPTAFTVTQTISTDWLYTGRGRLGFAFNKILVYGTGGVAATRIKYDALFTDTFATAHENASVDRKKKGWVGGGGVEVKLVGHWSVKGEFLLADFGQVQTTSNNLTAFSPAIAFPSNQFTHNADLTAKLFRGGINFHF